MILTEFIDPIIVDTFPEKGQIDSDSDFDLKDAPFLLSHLDKKPLAIPEDWTGCLLGSENLISTVQKNINEGRIKNVCPLKVNEPTSVKISNTNTIEVTLFSTDPINDDSSMLFLQDMYIKCFYTSCLGEFIDEFVKNSLLKKIIQNGIDVLYVDDTIYGSEKSVDGMHPTEYQLSALTYLVRPKEVIGIFGKEIPLHIEEFCQTKDYFKDISYI